MNLSIQRNSRIWLALFFLFSFTSVVIASDTLEDRITDVSAELMCPVCEGQSVAESNAQLARDMRTLIKTKLQQGESKQQILDYFVSKYGETILASPPKKGIGIILWLLPALSVLIGAVIIFRTIYSYKKPE